MLRLLAALSLALVLAVSLALHENRDRVVGIQNSARSVAPDRESRPKVVPQPVEPACTVGNTGLAAHIQVASSPRN